jgi:hypothetical protein
MVSGSYAAGDTGDFDDVLIGSFDLSAESFHAGKG